jgi:hypothetical protein
MWRQDGGGMVVIGPRLTNLLGLLLQQKRRPLSCVIDTPPLHLVWPRLACTLSQPGQPLLIGEGVEFVLGVGQPDAGGPRLCTGLVDLFQNGGVGLPRQIIDHLRRQGRARPAQEPHDAHGPSGV